MTITIAKVQNKLVQIVRTTDVVAFSPERGWIFIVLDFDKPVSKQQNYKWIPASTRFDWVREFIGGTQ